MRKQEQKNRYEPIWKTSKHSFYNTHRKEWEMMTREEEEREQEKKRQEEQEKKKQEDVFFIPSMCCNDIYSCW